MRQFFTRNFSNIGFGLGTMIMLILGVFTTIDLRSLIDSHNRVSHTLVVLSKLDETLSLITDAETAQRGYIITGEERFLEPYYVAVSSENGISQDLQDLRQLTSDNSDHQEHLDLLDTLAAEKLAFIEETIDLRRNVGFEAAQEAVLSDKGRQTMEEIRRVITEMRVYESDLLEMRSDAAAANLQNTLSLLMLGALLSFSLISLSFFRVNREIRDRRRAELALQQLNEELDRRVEQRTAELKTVGERFINTLDNILEGCQIIGYDWQYLYVNDAVARQGRKTKQELLGHTMMEMYPGIENTELFAKMRRCLQERIPFHWDNEFSYPDGSTGWFELSLQPVPEGLFILSLDITERKKAEESLRQRELEFRSLAENIPDVVARFDPQLHHLYVNDVIEEITGIPARSFIGHTNRDLQMPERQTVYWDTSLKHVFESGQTQTIEFDFPSRTGIRYFESRLVPESGSNGKVEKILSIARDITERKRTEIKIRQQLERLSALRTIDQAILSSFDLNLTLDILLTQVISRLQVDAADVLLLIPGGQQLDYAAGRGFLTNAIETAGIRIVDSRAAREGQLIHIEFLEDQPDRRLLNAEGASEGFVSYFGMPLIVKGKVIGVLEIFHRAPLQPDAEWFDFLNTLAGQAAIAVDNASLFVKLERSNQELSHAYDATIEGWSRALDLRDKETEGHTQRVTEMTIKLARAFGFSEEDLLYIRWGALLHDIGKLGVPDNILHKHGELTPDEWVIMRQHPVFAYNMLVPITYLRRSLDIPYYHHEKWDGTGYPLGLKGEAIPLAARLFAVVDVWDALRSDRPYRSAWTREKTLEYIESLSGTHFDPKVVEYFLEFIK